MSGGKEEEKEPAILDVASLDTYFLITMFISTLAEQAWRHLGIRMDPKTQEIKKDLERASVAIDCIECMVAKIQKALPEDDIRRLKSLLADLQINYARVSAS